MMLDRPNTADLSKNPAYLRPVTIADLIGRSVVEVSFYLGSYGMGGVGYTGWGLDNDEWLVLCIHASDNWIRLRVGTDDRIISAAPNQQVEHPVWWSNFSNQKIDDLPDFSGRKIENFFANPHEFRLMLAGDVEFYVTADSVRPEFAGTRQPRLLTDRDDLRVALGIFNSCYIDV
jgi:hypothetical protein